MKTISCEERIILKNEKHLHNKQQLVHSSFAAKINAVRGTESRFIVRMKMLHVDNITGV